MGNKGGYDNNDFLAMRKVGTTQFLVAHLNKWEGKDYFHLRLWHKKSGKLRPGKVGLTLSPDFFMSIFEVMEEAKETLKRRALGLDDPVREEEDEGHDDGTD